MTPNRRIHPLLPAGDSPRLGGLEADELLRHILGTVPGGLFTVDPQGTITSWNQSMEEITGFSADEVIGQTCSVLRGDACFSGPSGEEKRCALFVEGAVWRRRCRFQRRDGGQVPVLKNARLMRDAEGRVIGAIEALTDITGVLQLEEQVAQLRSEVAGRSRYNRLIGNHPAMQRLYDVVELGAAAQSSVLIEGETGTGKELVAHAIHHSSPRRDGPFVRVSCAALSENLLESELFGHVRGAFTGAVSDRVGRFEAAHGGTLFLDEIGDVSPGVQTKLLRVLQEREFERVGDTRPRRVDIRVIAATNKDLLALCADGRFREDLYYRLAVIPVVVPSLRERTSDIPLLVEHFVQRQGRALCRDVARVSAAAMERLVSYAWPGNVRELEHAIEYAFVVCTGGELTESCLPPSILGATPPSRAMAAGRKGPPDRAVILEALAAAGNNRTRAAASLGVSRVTLWKWLKAVGIDPADLG